MSSYLPVVVVVGICFNWQKQIFIRESERKPLAVAAGFVVDGTHARTSRTLYLLCVCVLSNRTCFFLFPFSLLSTDRPLASSSVTDPNRAAFNCFLS
jgi:hypothetical protein